MEGDMCYDRRCIHEAGADAKALVRRPVVPFPVGIFHGQKGGFSNGQIDIHHSYLLLFGWPELSDQEFTDERALLKFPGGMLQNVSANNREKVLAKNKTRHHGGC